MLRYDEDQKILRVDDKDSIDSSFWLREIKIIFEGKTLIGGIYDKAKKCYISDDTDISYTLDDEIEGTLVVELVSSKKTFIIQYFEKSKNFFGIRLRKRPYKEIAIILDISKKSQNYIQAFTQIAPKFTRHIFKEEYYTKLMLLSFTHLRKSAFGPFYEPNDFLKTMKSFKFSDTKDRLIYTSLIDAMRHFTKNNQLLKEIYLISSEGFLDSYNEEMAFRLTRNITLNSTFNVKEKEENMVKVHSFALGKELGFLKRLSRATKGTYICANTTFRLQKFLLILANDGAYDPNDFKDM